MNLVVNAILGMNKQVNKSFDEDYGIYGPEPDAPKSYRTETGFKAVVQDISSARQVLVFTAGKLTAIEEIAF